MTDPVSPALNSRPIGLAAESVPATVLRDNWDAHAKEWIDWVRAPGRQDSYWRFHRDLFLSLVPDPGQLTLDIGCGEGRVARDLQEHGHRVLGVDCSFTMCEAAATHPENPSRVIVGDAVNLPLADASADCAIAFMSLQDIDDMPGAIKEIARVLKDGQRFALAIIHPTYSGGKFSGAGRTPDDDFVIKRSYFKPELCISTDKHDSLTMTFYREHRPLQAYIQALFAAGFTIEQLHEVTDEDEDKPWHLVPMFLDVLAIRRPRQNGADSTGQPGSTHPVVTRWLWRQGHDHQTGARNPGHRRLERPRRAQVNSTRRVFAGYATVLLSLGLSVLIVFASSLAAAFFGVSHLYVCRP